MTHDDGNTTDQGHGDHDSTSTWKRAGERLVTPATAGLLATAALYLAGDLYYLGYDAYLSLPLGAVQRPVETQLLRGFIGAVPLLLAFGGTWCATERLEDSSWRWFASYVPWMLVGISLVVFLFLYFPATMTFPFTGTLIGTKAVFIGYIFLAVVLLGWFASRGNQDLYTAFREADHLDQTFMAFFLVWLVLAVPLLTGMVFARAFLDGAQEGHEDVILHFEQPDHPLDGRRLVLVTISGGQYYLLEAPPDTGPNPPGYIVPTETVAWVEMPPP